MHHRPVHGRPLRLLRLIHQVTKGHHRHGREQGRHHTEHDGVAHWLKHLPGHTLQKCQRNKHHAGGHRGAQDGLHHDAGSAEGRLGVAQKPPVLGFRRSPKAALQHHDGVIHHHTHAQHQSAHGDNVQGKARRRHQDHGQQNGGGNGAAHDQGRLIISEENENNRHGDQHSQHHGDRNVLEGA